METDVSMGTCVMETSVSITKHLIKIIYTDTDNEPLTIIAFKFTVSMLVQVLTDLWVNIVIDYLYVQVWSNALSHTQQNVSV